MEALYIEVGKCPRKVEIDGSLKSMQKLVGGFIECAYYFPDVVLVCNEEGMIQGMPINRVIQKDGQALAAICGNFFLCELDGDNLISKMCIRDRNTTTHCIGWPGWHPTNSAR